jgi:hypothetical protein
MVDPFGSFAEAVGVVGVGGGEDGVTAGVGLEVIEQWLVPISEDVACQRSEVKFFADL